MSPSDRQLIDAIKRGLSDRLADNKELIATGPGGIPEAVLAEALAAEWVTGMSQCLHILCKHEGAFTPQRLQRALVLAAAEVGMKLK